MRDNQPLQWTGPGGGVCAGQMAGRTVPMIGLLKSMRRALFLTLLDVQELRDRLPGEIDRGTHYEMERLAASIEAEPRKVLEVRPLTAAANT